MAIEFNMTLREGCMSCVFGFRAVKKIRSLTNLVVKEKGEAKATRGSVDFSFSLTLYSRDLSKNQKIISEL